MCDIHCSNCLSTSVKRNGKTRHGKQRYKCKNCQYQFCLAPTQKRICPGDIARIDQMLLERILLKGICRVMHVSMPWLLKHLEILFEQQPNDLNVLIQDIDVQSYSDEQLDTMIYQHLEKKDCQVPFGTLLRSMKALN